MKQTGKKMLLLFLCLTMLMSMMTVVTVGAADTAYDFNNASSALTGWTQWTPDGSTFTIGHDTTAGVDGTGSMKVTGIKTGGRINSPSYTWKKGNDYKITVWLKANKNAKVQICANAWTWMNLTMNGGQPQYYRCPSKTVDITTEWKEYTFEWSLIDFVTSDKEPTSTGVTQYNASVFLCPTVDDATGFELYADNLKIQETAKSDTTGNEIFTSGKGNGTESAPYELTTAEDFTKLSSLMGGSEDLRSAHYKLMNDIDMGKVSGFKGLATINDHRGEFSGTFDGNGHIISNLTVDRMSENHPAAGLFMKINKATIKNLGVENADIISGANPVGIFACNDFGGSVIENCFVRNSKVTNGYAWGTNYTGGMIGTSVNADSGITTFKNCYVVGLTTITRKGGAGTELITTTTNGAFKATVLGANTAKASLTNCYTDYPNLISNGSQGNEDDNTEYTVTNCYKSATTSTATAEKLGNAFIESVNEYNNGLPVLAWEKDRLSEEDVNKETNDYFTSGKGNGTESAPYELTTAEDFTKLSSLISGNEDLRSAHYKLMNDIDMGKVSGFKGLATINDHRGEFSGTFDGNGHIISNLTVDRMSDNHPAAGLFMKINKATIKNLGVENADIISGANPVGIFACNDFGGSVIENCFVRNSKVTNGYAWGTNYTGGMIGTSVNADSGITTFKNCYVVGLTTITRKGGAGTELITTTTNGAFKATVVGQDVAKVTLTNCYTDYPNLTSNGSQGNEDDNTECTATNCYKNATTSTTTAEKLGNAFIESVNEYNNGLPVLAWEKDRVPEKEPEVTDKETNDYFTSGKGNGTKELPYELTTVEDITKLSSLMSADEKMRSAHYKLMEDIDLSEVTDFKGITTISDARGVFSGTFDGNGHVISNMTVDRTGDGAQVSAAGLFLSLNKATIKNLGVENAAITGYTPVAVLAGRDQGGSTIENCFVRNATLTNTYRWGTNYTGGMIGIPDSESSGITTFNNCYVVGLTTNTKTSDTEYASSLTNGAFKATILGKDVVKATLNNCYTDYPTLTSNGATSDSSNNGEYKVNNSHASVLAGGKVNSMTLGKAYLSNDTNYNNGLPVLAWEESRMPARSDVKVVFEVGENGAVEQDGEKLSANAVISAKIGDDLTFTIVPDEDYQVEDVVMNGEVTVIDDNTITLSDLNTDTKIEITFVHSKFGGLTKPDKTILRDVKDAYITKEALETKLAHYTFDTEADVSKWNLTDEGKPVKGSTQAWDENGANGTTGAYKHTADGSDYRPRITGPNKINWNSGSKYLIKAWAKTDGELSLGTWLNHGAIIKTDFKPAGSAWLGLPNVDLTNEWKEYTWEFEITEITQDGTKLPGVSVEYNTRIAADNPEGTIWLDEISISEILPGYSKLGLMAESALLFPNESAPLTVVGNNGRNSYKVKTDGLTFTSFDEEVATVDANGVVTAKANGVTRIIVSDGEIEGAIDITVSDVNNAKEELHIALNGNDVTGDGSLEAPFATIERAKNEIRNYRRLPQNGVTVYLHEGEYVLSDTITFTEADSGKANAPITYKAYENDTVDFVGAKKVDTSKIQKVTDEALLDRLIEEHAKDNLYMIDLQEQGITMSPIAPYGWGSVDYPTQVFLNGVNLINARWPNDDKTGEQYFLRGEPATEDDLSADDAAALKGGLLNGNNQQAVMKFIDPDNRSAKWNVKSGDVLFGGAIAYLWAKQDLRVDYIDAEKKVVKTLDVSTYGQNTHTPKDARYFYFKNLFEEIDMPGESYMDREKGILYFYPVGNMEHPEMEVSVLNKVMVEFKGASNIVFDGINFRNSRRDAITINDQSDSISVKNAEISGMSGAGIITYGTNSKIDGCHIYNIGAQAVKLLGGDYKTLTSSGTELTNSKIHNTNIYLSNPLTAVSVEGVGHRIAHNELFDIDHTGIAYSYTNNVVTEYNKFYDNCRITADAGTLYWGRNVTEFGNIVRYNYFHDIGGNLGNYGQQAIFTDDGNIGLAIYGNIMYKGGLPEYPLKTGNGQFHRVYNNIFINSKVASNMSWWGEYHSGNNDEKRPVTWWAYHHEVLDLISDSRGNSGNFRRQKDIIYGDNYDLWKEYYSSEEMQAINSQWKLAFDSYLKEELYNEAKAIYDAKDADGLRAWFEKNLPSGYTNILEGNLLVDVPAIFSSKTNVAEEKNNLSLKDAEGKAIFENYGTDFNLTDAGLAKVRQTIPDFPDLDFDAMGLEFEVGGVAPVATNATIQGATVAGSTLTADYTYEDADGDAEGVSKIYWYVSNRENGTYERIVDGYGPHYTIPDEYEEKYIRYEVIPYDVKNVYGEVTVSEPVLISTKTNALLADLKVNGETIKNFAPEKVNYMVSLEAMPEITAEPAIEGAKVEITKNSDTLPTKFIITVTAVDGVTTKVYQIAVNDKTATPTPTPTPTPTTGPGTTTPGQGQSGITGGLTGGGMSSSGISGSTGAASGSQKSNFVDITGHWAAKDIEAMYQEKIVSGVTETTFEPDRAITRAEFATLVARALNVSAVGEANFKDVNKTDWYASYVNAAAGIGLIQGYDGYFRPNDLITRQEMAVILTKAYSFLGHTAKKGGIVKFADASEIADWAYDYVDQMTSAGLISGITDDTFAPKENTTRAQATAVLKRLLDK